MSNRELTTTRCVDCGRFMDCEDPDAVCAYTPDSDYSIESIAWTCGPCRRASQTTGDSEAKNE